MNCAVEKIRHNSALIVFSCALLLPLVVYWLTLAPDLTWAHGGADGGDLIVAAYTLGVPHPPGYPAYTLLAHLFTHLPVASIAFRVNLLSAVGASMAVGAVALTVLVFNRQMSRNEVLVGAVAAAWALAFSPLFWSQAVIAEVYAVQAAFAALVIAQSVYVRRHATAAGAWLLGLVWGVSLGVHLTCVFLLPIVVWGLAGLTGRPRPKPAAAAFCVGFLLASLQWLYLPLRAGKGAITWGEPTTLAGWWWMVSGALYRGYAFSLPLNDWPARVAYIASALLLGLGPLAVWLGVIELKRLAVERLGFLIACGLSMGAFGVFAIGYNTTDSDNYAIPIFIIFSVIVGNGIAQFLAGLRKSKHASAASLVVALVLLEPLVTMGLNWPHMSLANDHEAVLFGESVMNTAPPNAVLFSHTDQTTFALWYFRYVLEQRTDVLIVDEGLLPFDWYRAQVGIPLTSVRTNASSFSGRPMCQASPNDTSPPVECRPSP